MIIYKLHIILDEDDNDRKIVERSADVIYSFLDELSQLPDLLSNYDDELERILLSLHEIQHLTSIERENIDKNISGDDLAWMMNRISSFPSIIRSQAFQSFISPPSSFRVANDSLQFNQSSYLHFDDILLPTPTSIIFQSQAAECSKLVYIPRGRKEVVDLSLSKRQALLWKFRVDSDLDINFGLLVHCSDGNMAIDQVQTATAQYLAKTKGLRCIDIETEDETRQGSFRVLEPLVRVRTQNQRLRLQSSTMTRDGYVEGIYRGSSLDNQHFCRLIFDNSFNNLIGKHIELYVQVVNDDVVEAAITASDELREKLMHPRSPIYESILSSSKIHFQVDGPWSIDEMLLSRREEADQRALVSEEGYADGQTIVPEWVSRIGSIPLAGPALLLVSAGVAQLILQQEIQLQQHPVMQRVRGSLLDWWLPHSTQPSAPQDLSQHNDPSKHIIIHENEKHNDHDREFIRIDDVDAEESAASLQIINDVIKISDPRLNDKDNDNDEREGHEPDHDAKQVKNDDNYESEKVIGVIHGLEAEVSSIR